ncbi:BZ3500_MvSof-1268-A1-R1_Chr4-2g07100 [Microbotryum saponariae]|uniref:sphingolipid 4-desaturase n=1 Tax=Microbotryum saponariae TaxID=289078 RepID=A0A2X0KT25_9BASI|nr:BZ3500_MvSof-1268-A1-R1_Chr4-2g07100 [Microbotryum saponariae]SDA06765.1 BZ3501_MvSof-1269-A2-R1_Chr4-2g06811 [Microbotryum saponariae]
MASTRSTASNVYRHPLPASGFAFDLAAGAEVVPPSLLVQRSASSLSTSSSSSSSTGEGEDLTTGAESTASSSPALRSRSNSNPSSTTFAQFGATTKVGSRPGDEWAPRKVEPEQDPNDFLWLMTEEPHRTRRKAVLKAHPEIRKLMGYEPLTKYVVLFVMATQFLTAFYLRNTPFWSWKFWILAYVIGGTANQNIFLAVHEITHNLAFRGVKANRAFAILTNLPIGVPFAMMFKKYHIEHHKFLAEDGMDTDIPSRLELLVLKTVLGKTFFASFQIFFYALRPGFIRYQAPTRWVAFNWLVQLSFNALVVRYLGWYSMLYFLLSSHMAGSLHPCAGHFIAEHYLFDGHDQETWSYYGPLNILAYNVGYHNEHHDFPSVAWTKLPELRRIASDFYDPLPQHLSWPGVTLRFIFDPKVGMWSRVKRDGRGGTPGGDGGGSGLTGGLEDD